MKKLLAQAKTMDLKILILEVYATNKRAIHLYKKIGFHETGRIPKGLYRNGNYIDEVIITQELK
jgi:ribosomal protein S18 acetylase RimI-like enzyme